MDNKRKRCAYFYKLLDCKWKSPRHLNKLRVFLSDSPYHNEKDESGRTPLSRVLSCQYFSVDVVRLLLDQGADINARDDDDEKLTPLLVALASKRDDAVIRVLLEAGADASLPDSSGRTPVCYALRKGASIEVLRMILEGGCHPDACRSHGSAMYCFKHADAFYQDYVPRGLMKKGVLDLLIEAGTDVLKLGVHGESPICTLIRAGARVSDIQRLLELGARLEACRNHSSVWHCATELYDKIGNVKRWYWGGITLKADVVEMLRKTGIDSNSVNEDGMTPLQTALTFCIYQSRAIKLMFGLPGVDFNSVDELQRYNLLHFAVQNYHCKQSVVKSLIERGVKADVLTLELAMTGGVVSVVSFLLKQGSPVNAQYKRGFTHLDSAVRWKYGYDIIQLLLFAGARSGVAKDPDKNPLLLIALDHYLGDKRRNSLDVFKLLLKYCLLENPGFDMERSIWRHRLVDSKLVKAMSSLANKCVSEVQIMKSNSIGISRRLFYFVKRRSFASHIAAANRTSPSLSNKEFNRLLSITADNDLSQYFELISSTVGKSAMETKLQELQVYAINSKNVRVDLMHDCVCDITEFLSAADLLRLILAYAQANHASCRHDTGGKRRSKRILEQSAKSFSKHQKLNK